MTSRVVVLVDMDCFYCQVETRANADLVGKPLAVVQYNTWKGGGIIAVNYEARACGVTRNMRGDDAKAKCPDLILVSVPEVREKADLTKYRDAGKEVIQVLLKFGAVVERASVDEAYIDLTKMVERKMEEEAALQRRLQVGTLANTFVVGPGGQEREEQLQAWLEDIYREGQSDSIRLAVGSAIVEEMRAAVFEVTGFRCSAGIAHNKMLSKLACGINKPNRQTVLPHDRVSELFATLKVNKLRGLGGKLGDSISEDLHCETVGDLAKLSLQQIREKFDDKTSQWLFSIARGLEHEPVKERDLPKSIGCSKNFLGPKMLDTREKVQTWFGQLSEEVCEHLEKDRVANGRVARGVTVSINMDGDKGNVSRAGPLAGVYDPVRLTRLAMSLIGNLNESTADPTLWRPKLKNLSISANKFQDEFGGTKSIQNFFSKGEESLDKNDVSVAELVPNLQNYDESILEYLPQRLQSRVIERVAQLRREEAEQKEETKNYNLPPSSGNDDQKASGTESELQPCHKCQKLVSPFELPEHLDYHMAKELQSELALEVASASVAAGPSKTNKRKITPGDRKDDEKKKQKNILNFFQKK